MQFLAALTAFCALAVAPGVATMLWSTRRVSAAAAAPSATATSTSGDAAEGAAEDEAEDETATSERAWTRGCIVGLSTLYLAGGLLLRVGALTSLAVWIVAGVVAAISAAVVIWTRAFRSAGALRSGSGWMAAAALVGTFPVLATHIGQAPTLISSTTWYYAWNVDTFARIGHVPATMPEWGTQLRTLTDYPGLMGGAAALVAAGSPVLSVVSLMRLVAGASAGLGAWLLARRLGAGRPFALGAAMLLVAADVFFTKLSEFRPEAASYGLIFLAAASTIEWFASRHRTDLVTAALATAAANLVHPVGWVIAIVFVGAAALVSLARPNVRANAIGVAWLVGAVGLANLAVGALFGRIVPGGDEVGALPGLANGQDPTWAFFRSIARLAPTQPPPTNRQLLDQALNRGFIGWDNSALDVIALALAAGVVVMVVLAGKGNRARFLRAIAVLVVAVIGMLAFALWSSSYAPTYVPRRTGVSRIAQLLIMFVPFVAAVVLSVPRQKLLRITLAFVLPGAAITLLVLGRSEIADASTPRPTAAQFRAAQDLRLPNGSLILANAYTEGYLPLVVGTPGLLDGRAPYTPRADLLRANDLLAQAQRFFAEPNTSSFDLQGNGVTHVMVMTEPWALGSDKRFETDLAQLRRDPRLREVATEPGFVLFEVTGATAPAPSAPAGG